MWKEVRECKEVWEASKRLWEGNVKLWEGYGKAVGRL